MNVIRKLACSRKAWATLASAVTLLAGAFHVDLDPDTVYVGIAGIFSLYALAQGVADSSQRSFEPSDEERKILDVARRVKKQGLDLQDVVDMGVRALAATRTPAADQPPPQPAPVSGDTPRLTLGVIAAIGLTLAMPSVAWADGRYACYEESPWFRGLYDVALHDDDPHARGAAMGALSQWNCQPVNNDDDGDGRLDGMRPNPQCEPPPDCEIMPASAPAEPESGTFQLPPMFGAPTVRDQLIHVPRIRVQEEYEAPVWHPDENELGGFDCFCNRTQMAVGDEAICAITGRPSGPPIWTVSGPLTSSEFTGGRATTIVATEEGSGGVMFRDMACHVVYIHPRRPDVQDSELAAADERAAQEVADLQESIDDAVLAAVADERENGWTPQGWVAFIGGVGAAVGLIIHAVTQ